MRRPKQLFLLIALFFFVGATGVRGEPSPPVVNTTKIVGLDTLPWHFYWKKYIAPSAFVSNAPEPDLVLQPVNIWNDQRLDGKPIPSFGYATYRLLLHYGTGGQRLGLRISAPLSSYRLYVNGEKLIEEGTLTQSEAGFNPRRRSGLFFFTPASKQIDIVVHVANFAVYKGGLRAGIELGLANDQQTYGARYLAIDLFCVGLIFSIMLYHFLIFLLGRKNVSTLLFVLLSLDYFLLAFLFGEQSIVIFLPDLPLHLHTAWQGIFSYVLPALVVEFTGRLYPETISRRATNAFWFLGVACSLLTVLPQIYRTQYNVYFYGVVGALAGVVTLAGALRAAKQRRPGARLLVAGVMILFALTFYAVYLFATHQVAGSFLSIGFSLFALFQSGSLAHAHAGLERHNEEMRLRLERGRNALETQRKRIEANLHDSLGGNLTDIKLGLEALEKQAKAKGFSEDIRRLDHRVTGTIASLRTELLFLEDMHLAMKDFISGINLILLRRYQMAKRPVDISVTPIARQSGASLTRSGALGEEVIPELCLMVQELCSNSLKYSAGTARWHIDATPTSLSIGVTARTKRQKTARHGLGKETLRERATRVRARFEETVEGEIYSALISIP